MFAVAKQRVLMAGLVLRACYQAQSHDSSTKARRAETSAEGFSWFLLNFSAVSTKLKKNKKMGKNLLFSKLFRIFVPKRTR
jgi:hypothetical protein